MIEKLVVYPTFNCNMNCSYCFYKKNSSKYISVDKFRKAFKKFLKISKNPSVVFLGGEPLTNKKQLIKLVREIKKEPKEIPITIFTNGTLLDRKIIKFFKENNIKIVISIDGPKNINDKSRKYRFSSKSSFESIISKIKKLNIIQECSVNMVITKSNFKKISENIEHLYNLGFRSIGWNIDYLDNWKKSDIVKLEKGIKKVFIKYMKMLKEEKDIYEISNRYEIIDFLNGKKENSCRNIILYPDGNFYLCDKVINSKELLIKNKILEERKKLFKKFYKNYINKELFCPLGIYLHLKYEKKLPNKLIKKNLNIIYSMMSIIEKNTIRFFKIFLKYRNFRFKHKL